MHCHGVQRVVNPEPDNGVVEQRVHQRRHDPHDEGGPGLGRVAEGAGGDHPAQRPVDGQQQAPGAGRPRHAEGDQRGEARAHAADDGVDDGALHDVAVLLRGHRGVGAAVEREEAEHEDEGPECGVGHRVAGNVLRGGAARGVEPPDPGPEEHGAHERADPAQVVHHARAREVVVAIDGEPAGRGPGPVDHHRVDQGGDDGAVGEVGGQLAPLRHGAAHDSGGRGAEHKPEEPVGEVGGIEANQAHVAIIVINP